MSRFIVAIDQGTTGSTVLVFDEGLRLRARGYREFPQHFPQPGWVEHDPEEIWSSVLAALAEALHGSGNGGGVEAAQIAAIGITNQRETTLVWDRKTGQPLHRAIVWQDRRTADACKRLKDAWLEKEFRERTGLVLDPYFSGTKLAWLLEHVDGLRARADRGDVCFGTVDSYLVWRLSGGAAHVTDPSNASRTLLYDINERRWSPSLCEKLNVPRAVLPEVRPSAEIYATTRGVAGLPDGVPIAGMAGDQQAALFGQACLGLGEAKCTYGTGAFLLMNTGDRAVPSQNGLLTTVAWQIGAEMTYALEGSTFVAGAMVQWLRDGLGLISTAREIEDLAKSVPDAGGVIAVPALAGLGAPHWRPDARGLITGLTRGTTKAHLARAVLEGIALQIADLTSAMQTDAGLTLPAMRVDGGAAANDLLMQFQADILDVIIERPALVEATALGAAMLGGLGAGVWKQPADVQTAWRAAVGAAGFTRFEPRMKADVRAARLAAWRDAVARA
jgi:glycerol kinase